MLSISYLPQSLFLSLSLSLSHTHTNTHTHAHPILSSLYYCFCQVSLMSTIIPYCNGGKSILYHAVCIRHPRQLSCDVTSPKWWGLRLEFAFDNPCFSVSSCTRIHCKFRKQYWREKWEMEIIFVVIHLATCRQEVWKLASILCLLDLASSW